MAAKKSGGGATNTRNKNIAMAAYMKAHGIERHTCNCPLCHARVSLNALYAHLGKCGGTRD